MKCPVTLEDAEKILPPGDVVHTFRNNSFMLIGADWSKKDIITAIKKYGVERAGEQANRMNHGLVLKDERGHLFIETVEKN